MDILTPSTPEDFEQYFELRYRILRQPWGEAKGSEVDDDEDNSYHLMAVEGDRVVGVARLQFPEPGSAQLRYMAVDDHYQGKGIGKQIMQQMEAYARGKNTQTLFLHARENAVGFYLHLGYGIIETSYLLFNTIQHYRMIKKL